MNTIRRDGRVVDPRGRVVARLSPRDLGRAYMAAREARRRGGLGAFDPSASVGAELFELFNPRTVQAEYRAVGKEPPSVAEIITGAATAAAQNVEQGAVNIASGIFTSAKWIIGGLLVVGVLFAVSQLPRRRS